MISQADRRRNPNRRVSASDGPTRRRWTGFPNEEKNPFSRAADANGWYGDLPGASRMNRPHYDFRKRRYRSVPHTVSLLALAAGSGVAALTRCTGPVDGPVAAAKRAGEAERDRKVAGYERCAAVG